MALDPDPYRTLGLARGASLEEVRRAYRRLAKANHPDAAGEAALPRFLAIQAAYDQIVGPGASRSAGARRTAARRPWEADPVRADATRRAYGQRARRARQAGATGTSPPSGSRTDGQPGTGASPGDDPGPEGQSDGRRKRATLGSTSYDGADTEPFEPDWGGASWYGTTSGTYWTLNPKEYADPRKHGPEYQARGRRARPEGADAPPEAGATQGGAAGSRSAPSHTTSSWWDVTADETTAEAAAGTAPASAEPGGRTAGSARPPDASSAHVPTSGARADRFRDWLEPGRLGLASRVGAAAIGWVPIALGIGWLAGEVTGCGRFSATCDAGAAPIAWFAQVVVLALLLIVPGLARAAAIAAVATLAAAVVGALLLSAAGGAEGADADVGRAALGGLLVIAWLGGFTLAIARELRGDPAPPTAAPGPGPVS